MSAIKRMSDWVESIFESLASGIEFKGVAWMEGRYLKPDETSWGINLLEMAPALLQISAPGLGEGEECYGLSHNFDLIAAQSAFDEVAEMRFGIDNDGRHAVTIEGKVGEHEIAAIIYTEPFEDAEVRAGIENGKIWGEPSN
ncbi:MAG TPA: hypothetical protein VJ302_10655 [Blastocatellia bacterium]|nr:hypothetical protein [Blastocatellia bacterium]